MGSSLPLNSEIFEWLSKAEQARDSHAALDPSHPMSDDSVIQDYRREGQPEFYSRRPRHKTREDRYDARGRKEQEKAELDARPRKRKKHERTRRITEENVLFHGFESSNVTRDRLTVCITID
jgi:hypothetical protein